MLQPAPMLKARIVVLERDVARVATALGALGVVHLKSSVEESGGQLQPEDLGEELKHCNRLMGRLKDVMEALMVKPSAEALPDPAEAMSVAEVEELVATLERSIGERIKQLAAARQDLSETEEMLQALEPYRELSAPLTPLRRSGLLELKVGRIAPDQLGDLLSAMPPGVLALPVGERQREAKQPVDLLIVGARRRRFALDTVLGDHGFEQRDVPLWEEQSPAEVYREAARRREELRLRVADLQRDLGGTGRAYAGSLQRAQAALAVQIRVCEAAQNFGTTWATAVISGWVPAAQEEELRRAVAEATGGQCVVETAEPTPEDIEAGRVPSHMPHSWLLSPFRRLVQGYGVAGYTEIEPTILFTVSFLLLFGLIFGDLGHGLCLALIGLALKRLGRNESVRDTGHVILFAGLASMAFGTFFQGSFFGMPLRELGFPLTLGFEAIRFSGEQAGGRGHVVYYLLLAVLLGIVLISLGMVLNVINRLRRGDYVGSVLDQFGLVGMLFYWGVLGLSAKVLVFGPGPADVWVAVVVVALPLVVFTLHRPLTALLRHRRPLWEQNPLMELFEGAVGAVETVMIYMANTFSFLRVAAFALSHAALCFTIFVLLRLVRGLPGGPLWSAVVFVVGTATVIGLEGLIVAVQVLRLEYYEFFTKFFGGEGLPYRPFRLKPEQEAD